MITTAFAMFFNLTPLGPYVSILLGDSLMSTSSYCLLTQGKLGGRRISLNTKPDKGATTHDASKNLERVTHWH